MKNLKLLNLSATEIKKFHNTSLRILEEVGIIIDHQEASELLLSNSCQKQNGRICFPPELIEKCLKLCPHHVTLRGRCQEVTLGKGEMHVHNMGGARDVWEAWSGDLRSAFAQDVAESTRLLDAMEHVSTITPLYTPRDVPAQMMVLTMFDQTIRNTTKPINGPGVTTARDVALLTEMMKVVFGDNPHVSLGISPVSPLNFSGDIPKVIMEVAKSGLTLGPLPCPNVGATSPMSLAGSIVQQNAENLASIAIAQLVKPGLPIIYCGRLSVLNMRSGAPIWGNPEVGMMSAVTVQLGHHYGLPVNVYGLAASGFSCDAQSGYERAINALVPALAGADELSGVGEMAGGIFSSNAQIVIDNDIIGMIKHIIKGFSTDEDALAFEVIQKVMDGSHNFLKEPHTRKYLHGGEIWEGKIRIIESSWDTWVAAGKPQAIQRAQQIADDILSTHEIPPLSYNQINELDNIMHSSTLE